MAHQQRCDDWAAWKNHRQAICPSGLRSTKADSNALSQAKSSRSHNERDGVSDPSVKYRKISYQDVRGTTIAHSLIIRSAKRATDDCARLVTSSSRENMSAILSNNTWSLIDVLSNGLATNACPTDDPKKLIHCSSNDIPSASWHSWIFAILPNKSHTLDSRLADSSLAPNCVSYQCGDWCKQKNLSVAPEWRIWHPHCLVHLWGKCGSKTRSSGCSWRDTACNASCWPNANRSIRPNGRERLDATLKQRFGGGTPCFLCLKNTLSLAVRWSARWCPRNVRVWTIQHSGDLHEIAAECPHSRCPSMLGSNKVLQDLWDTATSPPCRRHWSSQEPTKEGWESGLIQWKQFNSETATWACLFEKLNQ